jgi:hypothetical protein
MTGVELALEVDALEKKLSQPQVELSFAEGTIETLQARLAELQQGPEASLSYTSEEE